MTKEKEYISDDDVIIIGGSEWKPDRTPNRSIRWKFITFILAGIIVMVGLFYLGRHIVYSKEFIQTRYADDIISALAQPMKGNPGITPLLRRNIAFKAFSTAFSAGIITPSRLARRLLRLSFNGTIGVSTAPK